MDKKRLILLIILLLAIVLIVLGVKGNVFKENRQNMELRSSGDDNKFYFFKYNIDGETVKIERIVR